MWIIPACGFLGVFVYLAIAMLLALGARNARWPVVWAGIGVAGLITGASLGAALYWGLA